ncbi:unnamed protein product, partial [Ectocarpus sp. 12 AP-2014]
ASSTHHILFGQRLFSGPRRNQPRRMSLPAKIVLPSTREGETVRRYALGLTDASYFAPEATPVLAENMVFNDLVFKMEGREEIQPFFAEFVKNTIVECDFEAINEAGSKNKYMVLYRLKLEGQEEPMVVC